MTSDRKDEGAWFEYVQDGDVWELNFAVWTWDAAGEVWRSPATDAVVGMEDAVSRTHTAKRIYRVGVDVVSGSGLDSPHGMVF